MKPTVERAFELARSGECRTFSDIRRRLKQEGHGDTNRQLDGRFIRDQITSMIAAAKAGGSTAPKQVTPARRLVKRVRPPILD